MQQPCAGQRANCLPATPLLGGEQSEHRKERQPLVAGPSCNAHRHKAGRATVTSMSTKTQLIPLAQDLMASILETGDRVIRTIVLTSADLHLPVFTETQPGVLPSPSFSGT